MKKNNIILVSSALLAPFLFSCAEKQANEQKLNIIHIMTDDHSFQTISAYGHPISQIARTPNIDRLADEGMLFTSAYVENSLSTPSRACLMTGLYSHQNGQRQLGAGIDTSKVFFSQLLQDSGYQTGVVGKWHMQCEPKGFDFYHILNDQGEYYNPRFRSPASDGEYIQEEGYATVLTTDHSIRFLEERDKSKPFCLLVHHKAPHRNWMPDSKHLTLYEDVEFPYPDTFHDDYSTRCLPARSQEMSIDTSMTMVYDLKLFELRNTAPYATDWSTDAYESMLNRMTPKQRKAWDDAYSASNKKLLDNMPKGEELVKWKYQRYLKDYLRCIKSIDEEVGRLLDYLEKENLMENTVIVYTSDQGFYMGEHGWFDKRFMYEESFRTPLIIKHPKAKLKKAKNTSLVQNLDYAPTYLALAGIGQPAEMSGASLLPLLNEEKQPEDWRQYLYYHYYDYPAVHQVRKHDGVRDSRYKLIHFYGKGFGKDEGNDMDCYEFYDLQQDPKELYNRYGNLKYKGEINRLQERLDKFREDLKVDEF